VDENGSGCSTSAIVQSLGLKLEDLWPKSNGPAPKSSGKRSWKTPEEALRFVASKIEPKPIKTQSWTYHDAHGKPLMVVGRIDAADGSKTYRPVHILPDGSWAIGDPPESLPLYNLPRMFMEGLRVVFVTEGEKCADAVKSIGFTATTSAHGAESAHKTDWMPLAGQNVIILPDNDPAGEGYALSVLRQLKRLDPRPRVKVVRLPGLADGEDFVEWSARIAGEGPEHEAAEAIRFELTQLIQAIDSVDLDAIEDTPRPMRGGASQNGPTGGGIQADQDDDSVPLDVRPWPDAPDPEAYHGVLGEIVRAIEPHTEADPLGIMAHLIAMFGNVVGRSAYVQVEATRHYLNEFMITVGRSALSRKGTAGDRARHVFNQIDAVWVDERVKDGLSSGEGMVTAVKDPVEGRVAIKEKGRVVDWQMVVTDPGVTDKRLFILESEFAGVLHALQREGNRLSALIRQAWDSGNLRSLTKTPWIATNAHISIVGHITATELLHLLSEIDFVNGFANRFWWFAVRGGPPLPFGGMPEGLGDLTAQLEDSVKDARAANRITWTPEARDLWKSSMYCELRDLPVGRLGEVLNRSAPHVLRVAGIFCLADRTQAIEPCHLIAAKALWDASIRCATYIFGDSLGDPVAEKILGALREVSPAGLTRTELHAVLQRHVPTIRIKQALAVLISGGLARETREASSGGRLAWNYYALANSAKFANSGPVKRG
jgi:hypothetical protein